MKFNRLIILFILVTSFGKTVKAVISKADYDTLFVNLKQLETGWVQHSVNICNGIFDKNQYTLLDWTGFFKDYFSINSFSSELKNYIGYPPFYWLSHEVHVKLQESQLTILLTKVDSLINTAQFSNKLGNNIVYRDEVFTILNYLADLSNIKESVLRDSSRFSIYQRIESQINSFPDLYSHSQKVNLNENPYLSVFGLQLQVILLKAYPLNDDRIQYMTVLFRLPDRYVELFHKHQLYLADNNGMSVKDIALINNLTTLIPDTLTDLRVIQNLDYYYTNE